MAEPAQMDWLGAATSGFFLVVRGVAAPQPLLLGLSATNWQQRRLKKGSKLNVIIAAETEIFLFQKFFDFILYYQTSQKVESIPGNNSPFTPSSNLSRIYQLVENYLR